MATTVFFGTLARFGLLPSASCTTREATEDINRNSFTYPYGTTWLSGGVGISGFEEMSSGFAFSKTAYEAIDRLAQRRTGEVQRQNDPFLINLFSIGTKTFSVQLQGHWRTELL